MLRWFIGRRLAAFERTYGYDLGYARQILAADLRAFLAVGRLQSMSAYRGGLPADVAAAVKIVGTVAEDCGPCTQLVVTMALRDGVAPATERAGLAGDDGALSPGVALGVRFARAVLAHDAAADELRDQVRARWGERAVVAVGLGLVVARAYPTLKYALGHGHACARIVVDGAPAPVVRVAA
jgi:hypothetical protein